ncbi:MAG: DUF1761 family protein [Actinomycetales bacterium]|nr:DUF1761 family protein [Actinomycetales bacterium]
MPFSEINWLAVLVASFVSFLIGFAWFSPKTLFPVWWKAMGRGYDEPPTSGLPMGVVFGLTILGVLVQATVLALVIELVRMSGQEVTWAGGLAVGALMGVGFAAAASLSHHLFAGFSIRAWILEVGQDIVCLAAMGAILGAWA